MEETLVKFLVTSGRHKSKEGADSALHLFITVGFMTVAAVSSFFPVWLAFMENRLVQRLGIAMLNIA